MAGHHLLLGVILLLSISLISFAHAQEGELPALEELLESEEDFDPEQVLERLAEMRRSPLDPNRASFSQLQQIPYLSVSQIKDMIGFRKTNRFQKVEDLLQVPGMDPATLSRIKPFLHIRAIRYRWSHLRSRLALSLPSARGYREKRYQGNPLKTYLRLDMSVDEHIRMGVLSEKDPGENAWDDYRSFYVQLEDIAFLHQAILGSYAVEFGQGLVLWSPGGSMGGARSATSAKLSGRGIRPYTSTDENLGLRGLAMTAILGFTELSIFFSRAFLDATLEGNRTTGLYRSGLHRTGNEMAKKDVLEEVLLGGHIQGQFAQDKVLGLTWYRSRFRPGLQPPDDPRGRYDFRGQWCQFWGGYVDMVLGPLNFFGESALDGHLTKAATVGFSLNEEALRAALVWRHYPPEFCNLHGGGMAAKEPQNESGVLLALDWSPFDGTRLELLADQYQRPWRTYLLEMPSGGEKWSLQMIQKLGDNVSVTVRHQDRRGQVPAASNLGMSTNSRLDVVSRRLQLDWRISGGVRLRGRLQTSRVCRETQADVERGASLLVQMTLLPHKTISLRAMVVLFHVPTYDGRIYVCEVGPAGVARNVALYGRGSRALLLGRWGIGRGVQVSAKLCRTRYEDRQSMGVGAEQVEGHVKNEVLLQFDWKW